MRSIIVGVLAFAALARAAEVLYPRGCIYNMGKCVEECPIGTHAYALGCGQKTPEATCKNPNPVPERGILCDYSACYCDAPTVRDQKTNKCVLLEDCSPQDVDPEESIVPVDPTPAVDPVVDPIPVPVEPIPEPVEPIPEPVEPTPPVAECYAVAQA